MATLIPLPSGWHVDQAITQLDEEVVVIRFGTDGDDECMVMDETLSKIVEQVSRFAYIFKCDIREVPDFNKVMAHKVLLNAPQSAHERFLDVRTL